MHPVVSRLGARALPTGLVELAVILGGGALLGLLVTRLPVFLWPPLLAGIGSTWLALAFPRRAVQLAVFLVPWQIFLGNWPGVSFTFRLADIVVGSTLLIALLRQPRGLRLALSWWLWPVLVFAALGVTFGLVRGDWYAVGKFVVDWWVLLAFYWLMLLWAPHDWKGLVHALLLAFSLQAVLALLQTAVGDMGRIRAVLSLPMMQLFFEPDFLRERLGLNSFNFVWRGRAFGFGTYLNSIGLGVNLAVSATLAVALALRSRRLFSSHYFYVALLLALGCVLVLKRSGWVALGAGFLVVVWVNLGPRWRSFKRAMLLLGLACLVAIPVVALMWSTVLERATDQAGWEYARDRVWPVYVDLLRQRPVIGYGPGYPLGSVATGLAAQYGYTYDYSFGPENAYLHAALIAGVPGLALVLIPVGLALRRFWRVQPHAYGFQRVEVASALSAFLVGGIFVICLSNLQVGGSFYLLLALARAQRLAPRGRGIHG